MITEDYVSFETAKLLKEKGFDVYVSSFYDNEGKFSRKEADWNWNIGPRYSAPTLQMAMKWLREVHNIAVETEWEHLWYAYVKPMTAKPSEEDYYQCESSKYEEACEAAIKYCLENLI
jgi:hypothetical protein